MKSVSKWLLASGAFLLILGFLLPIISISSQSTENVSISLLQVAGFSYWFFLFLIPISALLVLLLALIPIEDPKMTTPFLIGKIGGLSMVFLLLLGTLAYFLIMPQQLLSLPLMPAGSQIANSDIWPGIGLFVLLSGVGLTILGILAYFFPVKQEAKQDISEPKKSSSAQPSDEAKSAIKDVYLEATRGNLSGKKFPIYEDDFSIGRGRDNNLQLSSTSVSRLHARLRYSQGSWFIQDQSSKIGIFVNGKSVKAVRLNSGDHIKIGDDTFVFHT